MLTTEYWRANKNWAKYLGKRGRVISASMMEVAASDQTELLPYAYLLVELEQEKISLMGSAHQKFEIGDEVEIVLRKIKKENQAEIISYGLKAANV